MQSQDMLLSRLVQEWGRYRQCVIKEEESHALDVDTQMGQPSPSAASCTSPEGTLDLPPPPITTYRTDLQAPFTPFTQSQATQVHDKVLADTRAALDHLEKQLCLAVSPQTQTTTPPVTTSGSPGFNLEDGDRRELDMQTSDGLWAKLHAMHGQLQG